MGRGQQQILVVAPMPREPRAARSGRMAAHKSRRRARAIELDPLYVDVAIRRWQSYTGQMATMAVTGESFAEVEQRRRDPLQ